MLVLLTVLQLANGSFHGPAGLSNELPLEAHVQIVCRRADSEARARIAGTSPIATTWSRSAIADLVGECGIAQASLRNAGPSTVIVSAPRSANAVMSVRCIKAKTSLRFSPSIKERGFAAQLVDEEPFRELWTESQETNVLDAR